MTSKRLLAKRGEKDIHETMGGSGREYITILGCGCADGTRLPPYVVYKGKNLWARWMKNGPASCLFSVSDSGWMEGPNFLQWFTKMFVSAVKPIATAAPVVLFFDGHHSHISLKLLEVARSNNIHLVCFPPHVTHILQPLDFSVFGPAKSQWRSILKTYQIETRASVLTKEEFPHMLAELYEKAFLPKHFKSGFRKCGLHPLNREAIPSSKLSSSLPFTGKKKGKEPKEAEQRGDESSQSEEQTTSDCSKESGDSVQETEVILDLQGTVTIEEKVTPVHLELRGYFAKVLAAKKKPDTKNDKRKIKPKFYGEALTTDEVFQKLEEAEAEKEQKRKALAQRKEMKTANSKTKTTSGKARVRKKVNQKKRKTPLTPKRTPAPTPPISNSDVSLSKEDTGICEECGAIYADDSTEAKKKWMGCDNCPRWYHYDCIGLTSIPSGFWSCDLC